MKVSIAALVLTLAASPALAQLGEKATVTPEWRVSFIPGVVDDSGRVLNATEIRAFATMNGKLYAATGAWKDQGDAKGDPMVIRLDASDGNWQMEADLGGAGGTTGALARLDWEQSESGAKVNVSTLVASIWNGALVFVKNNTASDLKWYKTSLNSDGQIRAFTTHTDKAANKEWSFAGGKPGVWRGQLSNDRGAGQNIIHWQTGVANTEINTANIDFPLCSGGGRVTGFAESRGKLFLSVCWRIYVRTDGDQGDCTPKQVKTAAGCEPRWVRFWDDPKAAQGESGLRGLTTVTVDGKQYLLVGSESGAMHISRVDPDTAASEVEIDISGTLNHEFGSNTGYGIIPYNSPTPLYYGPDGVGRRIFGLEVWEPGSPTLNHARKLTNIEDGSPQIMNGEGWFFLRNTPDSYQLFHIPAITPQPMTAVRDAIASPFADECNAQMQDCWVYFGGFDANKSDTQTPCLAEPCTFPPLVALPTHNTGWIVKGKPLAQ